MSLLKKLDDLCSLLEMEMASTPASGSILLPKPQRVELRERNFQTALRQHWPEIRKALSDQGEDTCSSFADHKILASKLRELSMSNADITGDERATCALAAHELDSSYTSTQERK